MIALWRRVRRAVGGISEGEWALLAVETVAVIAGILIAFELEQWAEDRREQGRIRHLLERLLVETRTAVAHYDYYAKEDAAALKTAQANLLAFADGNCPADMGDVDRIDRRVADPPSNAALTELISVVGLSSIPDKDLQSSLSAHYYGTTNFYYELDHIRQKQVPLLAPDDQRRRLEVDRGVASRENGSASALMGTADGLSRIRYDQARMCADPEFRQRYIASAAELLRLNGMRNDMLMMSYRLCGKLASAIDEKCVNPDLRGNLGDDRIRMLDDRIAKIEKARASSS